MKIRAFAGALSLVLAVALPGLARAQGHHDDHSGHSDIEIGLSAGRIVLFGGEEAANGHKVYEGEFTAPDYFTDDPGFATPEGESFPGLNGPLVLSGIGPLMVFGDDGWTSSFSSGVSLVARKDFSRTRFWEIAFDSSGMSVVGDSIGEIGTVANGGLHEHIDFFLDGPVSEYGTHPAFAIKLALAGAGGVTSDPFYIAFNNGMDHEAFEAAIAAIPEPGTYALMGAGLLLVAAAGRRRKVSQKT